MEHVESQAHDLTNAVAQLGRIDLEPRAGLDTPTAGVL